MRIIFFIAFVLFLALSFRFYFFFTNQPQFNVGDKVNLEYTFLSEPKTTQGSQVFTVRKLKVYSALYPALHYGDTISASGTISETSYISKQNGQLIRQLMLRYPAVKIEKNKNSLLSITSFIRQRVAFSFNKYLPHNESGLLLGILMGGNSGLDSDFYTSLKNTGVLHVVAASGMNVSMVGEFLLVIFILFFPRRVSILLTIAGIAFYAVLSGLEPSILRASVMAIMAYSAQSIGRQNYSLLSLTLAAFIMLIIDPELVFDIGFRLSFLSTFGIVYLKPLIDGFLPRGKLQFFSSDFSTTIAAQLGSLPVLVASFSSYSLVSILVNSLVLWTIPILMILGGVGAILSLIAPVLSMPFLYLSWPLLLFFTGIVNLFGGLGLIILPQLPGLLYLGYFLILFSLALLAQKKKVKSSIPQKHE